MGYGRMVGCSVLVVAVAGCTVDDGKGFARLEPVTVSAAFSAGHDNLLVTEADYRVRLQSAELAIESIVLERGAGEAAAFDPADPPPGYENCHGGHCHAEDGSLVDYEDIAAESQGEAFEPVVQLFVTAPIDLWSADEVAVDRLTPSRELPRGQLSRLSLRVAGLTAHGSISGGPAGLAETPLDVALSFEGATLHEDLALAIDEDSPESIGLHVELTLDATLFEHLDFAALSTGGEISLKDAESAAGLEIGEHLQEAELHAHVE